MSDLALTIAIVVPLWAIMYQLAQIAKQLAALAFILKVIREEISLVGRGD